MDKKTFTVTKIEGEYAYLTPTDGTDELFIAMALLPFGTDLGTTLIYENLSFSVYN